MPEIIYRKLKDLKLLGNNPRQIGKTEFNTLCKSLIDNPDYFEARPLILSDRTGELVTIAGNMRYRAAKHNKQKEVPTILLSGLTEEREAEIIIRDNVNNGSWDVDILANEWTDYPLSDWGLDVPGFEDDEAGNADAEPQMDKAAELNKKWKVKTGDLWQIGSHRLVCGDSTNPQDVARVLDGAKPHLCVTDPPYGVNQDKGFAGARAFNGGKGKAIPSRTYADEWDSEPISDASVFDAYAGSGTTLVACQNLNRKCYAIEISENYCAVILERMQTAFPDIEIKRIEQADVATTAR